MKKKFQEKSMNNPSNIKMQYFLLSMQNVHYNFQVKQSENERIFFIIFVLRCFQDEKQTQPYANLFFFFK
jgi:hypothetical protein